MAPVDRLQVLEEELLELGYGEHTGAYADARAALGARRAELDAAAHADRAAPTSATGEVLARARAEHERVYAKVLKLLNDRLHTARRSALCFSGGGIRSATFGLGVLHSLARYSRPAEQGQRPTLVGEFDYLSTVSGGGYLGSWFSGWAAREGSARVIETLAATPIDARDPEPASLRYLRNYTAYLAPRAGLTSVDTWTLLSTVLRNMFLNWLIIVPIIAALVLVPRIVQTVVSLGADVDTADWLPALNLVVLVAGTATGVLASFNMALALPGFGARVWSQGRFVRRIVVPVGISACALTTYWAWHVLSGVTPRHSLSRFAIFGAAMHGLGAVAGALTVLAQGWNRLRGDHDHAWLISRIRVRHPRGDRQRRPGRSARSHRRRGADGRRQSADPAVLVRGVRRGADHLRGDHHDARSAPQPSDHRRGSRMVGAIGCVAAAHDARLARAQHPGLLWPAHGLVALFAGVGGDRDAQHERRARRPRRNRQPPGVESCDVIGPSRG